MTIEESFNLFIQYTKSYCAKDTIAYYRNCLHLFEKFLDECNISDQIDIREIDRKLLVEYIVYLRNRDISDTSLRSYIRGLKVYLRYLFYEKYIPEDITQRLKLPKADSRRKMPLSVGSVKIIDDYFDREGEIRNKCIFHLMLDCGLRLQEVVNLNISDIQYNPATNSAYISICNSKNNKSRTVPLPGKVEGIIRQYVRTIYYPESGPLIRVCSAAGTRLTKDGVKTYFGKLKNILPEIHAHLLRHTFATSFIMGGGNLENLRVLMGHSSYSVTQNYISLASELSLVKYDIYRIDDIFFESYDYHKRN